MDFKIDPRILTSHATQPGLDKKTRDLQALRESSREFETLMVMEMLKAMRKSVPEGGLFEKDVATDTFTEMLDMETAKATTSGKGLGIAELMYNQMAELIEKRKDSSER
jgi:flagellar protein FlgJ